MSYCIIWEFEVAEAQQPAFEAAYGSDGPWARLFRRSEGFLGTQLYRSCGGTGVYLIIDRWSSEEAFGAFRRNFATDYEALDKHLEGMASRETRIGAVVAL